MSTLAIIAIVIGVLVLLALIVSAARKKSHDQEFGQVQSEAQHDDARHHRERAEESRTEAAIAEERAKRAEVEAQLDEERATQREGELDRER